jgi:hypothetical protein
VGLGGLAALDQRAERPREAPKLEDQEALDDVAGRSAFECAGADEQRRAAQTHGHAKQRGGVEPHARRQDGVEAEHPEGRNGDDQRGEAAGDPEFGDGEAAVADAEDDDAVPGGLAEFDPAGQLRAHELCADQHQGTRNQEAPGHERHGREGLQRHADAKVRRAPEEAHGHQGGVRPELRAEAQSVRVASARMMA